MARNLLITLDYPPNWGGVSEYYGQLARHWPAEAGVLDVLDNSGGRLWPSLPAGRPVFGGGILKWLKMLRAVARSIQRGRYERVLVGQVIPLGWAAYVLKVWLGWIFKFEYGVFLHGLDFSLAVGTARRRWATRRILMSARWIICANSYTAGKAREFLRDEAAKRKIFVVNPGVEVEMAEKFLTGGGNGLDTSEKNGADGVDGGAAAMVCESDGSVGEFEPMILTVGRLVKRKGIDKMLLAMPEILKKYPQARYVAAGDGPELENLRVLAEKLGLTHCVRFENEVEQEQKWQLYRGCEVFVLPALDIGGDYEGFGIVYLEAGLAGKPVVAGRSGGVTDAVVDGETGLIVEAGSVENLAAAVLKLLDDAELRRRMGAAGRERAERDFNWEQQAGRVAEIVVK